MVAPFPGEDTGGGFVTAVVQPQSHEKNSRTMAFENKDEEDGPVN
jgi:hypothetical protein